jgi:hypothetical protein
MAMTHQSGDLPTQDCPKKTARERAILFCAAWQLTHRRGVRGGLSSERVHDRLLPDRPWLVASNGG